MVRLIHEVIEHLGRLPDGAITPIGAALEERLGGERGSLPELAERFAAAPREMDQIDADSR